MKPQACIVNCTTGKEIIRDFDEKELQQIAIDAETTKNIQKQIEAHKKLKQQILDRIGLTADELKLLLG